MDSVNEINLEGFQVVSSDFFTGISRVSLPTLTVWDGCIGFSKQGLLLLNSCENIIMQINAPERKVLIIPTTSKDKDAIRWVKGTNPVRTRKFSCPRLTDKLYEIWGWDKEMIYRSTGRLATAANKVMLYFDFTEPEQWKRPDAKKAE